MIGGTADRRGSSAGKSRNVRDNDLCGGGDGVSSAVSPRTRTAAVGRNTRRRGGIRFSSIVENAFSRAAVTLLAGTEVSCTAKIIRYVLARWRSFTVRRPADDVFNCSAVTWPSVSSKFHGREFTTSTAHYRIARRRARVHTIHKYTHTPTTLTSNFSVRNVVVIVHSLLIPRYRVEAFLF